MKAFSRFQQPPLLSGASNLFIFASLCARRCWPILRLLHRFVLALALAIITEPLVTLSFGFLLDVTRWPVPHLGGSVWASFVLVSLAWVGSGVDGGQLLGLGSEPYRWLCYMFVYTLGNCSGFVAGFNWCSLGGFLDLLAGGSASASHAPQRRLLVYAPCELGLCKF